MPVPEITEQNMWCLMKRITIIGITFCLVLLATFGTCAAAAPVKLPPQLRVEQFDVPYNNEIVGKLSVSTMRWTYVLNAHGLEPGSEYYLYYLGRYPAIGNGTANENGDLHMAGRWPANIGVEDPVLQEKLVLTDGPLAGSDCEDSVLTAKYHPGLFKTTVWGSLKKTDGTPLANQWLYIYRCSMGVCEWIFSSGSYVPTASDGDYLTSGKTGSSASLDVEVNYEYGYAGGTFYCEKWTKASYSASAP